MERAILVVRRAKVPKDASVASLFLFERSLWQSSASFSARR
jgi:hypothetical protein